MGQISFGAFPRSGNFFTNWSMCNGLVENEYKVFEHNAHQLLQAPNRFTIIRNPLDAVSSAIIHYRTTKSNKVDSFTEWYVDYYSQCLEKGCLIVSFDDLINDSKQTFLNLADQLGVKRHRFNKLDYSVGDLNATKPTLKQQVFGLKKQVVNSDFYIKALTVYEKAVFN